MSTEAKQEVDHARANAAGWLESIREMVANLDVKTAADEWSKQVSREDCIALLLNVGIDSNDDEPTEDLREACAVNIADETIDWTEADFEFDADAARQTIEESVLEVTVRSDWYSPGASADDDARKPNEFCILLSTGGPALRLIGELDEHGQPTRAWLEYQDWGTPWTHYYVEGASDVLLEFASVFYFGE